ncbi:MAG: FAD-dependent thymidylate synthase [Candidatus Methylarchaceae archaeon HK01B]|nr:FAD-dependent thymidylate synthase [Candidatus Methylarchaceae archaeon HK01B]
MKETKVVLISYTPDIERVCASAMRSCYSQHPASKLYLNKELLSDSYVERMLEKALQLGHYDVMEHGSLTYSLENVSRVLTHQLVRHRLASFSQQSQRYVMIGRDEWYIKPPSIDVKEKVQVEVNRVKIELGYDDFMALSGRMYEAYSEKGLHKEDVRFITPSACKTNITITANPREFRHIFSQRCDSAAQWEIRDVCWAMFSLAKLIAPTIFKTLDLPAGKDPSAVERCTELDDLLSDYRSDLEKENKGSLVEIDLSMLNLSHKVRSYIFKI